MSYIGRLWFKWVDDDTKPHYKIGDVPPLWKDEVQGYIDDKATREANEATKEREPSADI